MQLSLFTYMMFIIVTLRGVLVAISHSNYKLPCELYLGHLVVIDYVINHIFFNKKGGKMKIKHIILGSSIAFISIEAMALLPTFTSSQSKLINFTTDEDGILFSTSYRGDSPCVKKWGNEYRISIDHPNYKAMASALLAISMDPQNSPFSFTAHFWNRQGLSRGVCSNIDKIHRYIGQ